VRKRYPAPGSSEDVLAGWAVMSTPTGPGVTGDGWPILVPVKALPHAKTRLITALSPAGRRALVLGMASDVLVACADAPGVSLVRVITSDPDVSTLAEDLGLETVPDPRTTGTRDPLSAAVDAVVRGTAGPVGVVTADLPELRASLLGRLLGAATAHPHSTVPDHRGSGTTMAFWSGAATGPDRDSVRVSRFGPGSAARFRVDGGAVDLADLDPGGAGRRDVDTPEDLAALTGRTVGAATAAALRVHSGTLSSPGPGVSATMVS